MRIQGQPRPGWCRGVKARLLGKGYVVVWAARSRTIDSEVWSQCDWQLGEQTQLKNLHKWQLFLKRQGFSPICQSLYCFDGSNPISSKKVVVCASFSVGFPPKKFSQGNRKKREANCWTPHMLKKVSFMHFFASQKLTQSPLLKMLGSCNFFVNQSGASKNGVLGVHFRPKQFK